MDQRKQKRNLPWDEGIYGTGRTSPRKSHGALVAMLLILVIFLSGVVVFLSVMNVRLVSRLTHQAPPESHPMVFSAKSGDPQPHSGYDAWDTDGGEAVLCLAPSLGLQGEALSAFDRYYYGFPDGLMITAVTPGSDAQRLGIDPGDLLLAVGEYPITGPESLEEALQALTVGQQVPVIIYRSGRQYTVKLTVTEAE